MSETSKEHLNESKNDFDRNDCKGGLHEMRKSVDALIQWADELRGDRESGYGREMSLVHTKLQEAKMWVGKCLEKTGNELPKEFQDKAE